MSRADIDLQHVHAGVRAMQSTAEGLLAGSEGFPALNRNILRIQAALKMLELGICDLVDMDKTVSQ